jgi:hypothetical protein
VRGEYPSLLTWGSVRRRSVLRPALDARRRREGGRYLAGPRAVLGQDFRHHGRRQGGSRGPAGPTPPVSGRQQRPHTPWPPEAARRPLRSGRATPVGNRPLPLFPWTRPRRHLGLGAPPGRRGGVHYAAGSAAMESSLGSCRSRIWLAGTRRAIRALVVSSGRHHPLSRARPPASADHRQDPPFRECLWLERDRRGSGVGSRRGLPSHGRRRGRVHAGAPLFFAGYLPRGAPAGNRVPALPSRPAPLRRRHEAARPPFNCGSKDVA